MEKNFNASTAEAAISTAWAEAGAFRAGANKSRDETFCIMIPPPNVTGVLHMGHAFNNTLQDILTRWHRMRGYDTLWQPGMDHAGIATQMVVERELAKGNMRRTDMSRSDFLAKVWEWKEQSGGQIIEQLKRLGASCDWERTAFTMAGAEGDTRTGHENSANFHDAVIKVFVEMYNKGLIYRGKRLVNWDPHFETAISDLEVENLEVDGHMWHFKYPLAGRATYEYVEKDEEGNITLRETRDYISIATTRPETMLGDGAVAVHPSDERYAPIIGKLCEIPVGPKEHRRLIPIITDEYPDPDFGSGAVKITGAHDFNDYGVAKRNNIPLYSLMDTKGAMRADGLPYVEAAEKAQAIAEGAEAPADVTEINLVPEHLRGLDRFEARKRAVAEITAEGLAVMVPNLEGAVGGSPTLPQDGDAERRVGDPPTILETEEPAFIPLVEAKKIMQPFGDRSKVVIEPMLTDQWFVDTAKIVGPAIEAVEDGRTEILPEQHKKVYFNWLREIEPWCISRQLWWGHQIPVWYGPRKELGDDAGEKKLAMFCAADEESLMEQLAEYYGEALIIRPESTDEFWRVVENYRFALDKGISDKLDGKLLVPIYRDPDVLDTWFSSGLWPIGTLGWPEETEELKKYFPTDVLITGFDIIFFWVARMMMMQLEVVKEIPFHTVYVHALVRDEKGKKMSKSLGNVLDPLELIDEFGADAVRFTLTAMAAMGRDLKLSTDRIKGYRNFGTKLWNAVRFAEMNGCHAHYQTHTNPIPNPEIEQTVNKWILGETARVREAVDEALKSYRFNDAANALYAHVWGTVCDWYVEFAKPLLQSEDAEIVAETRACMAWALDQCMILLHPIMPFITEELWRETMPRDNMLVHEDWPTYTSAELSDPEADREMRWVVELIEQIRSLRAEVRVPVGAKIPLIQLDLDVAGQGALERNWPLIQRLARITEIERLDAAPKGAVTLPMPGGTFCLPLADVIDIAEEKARLAKAKGKLEKEKGGLSGKLGNAKFIANAPEEVVDEARTRLEELEAEIDKLAQAETRLEAMG
ncbi:MAG: valine--tRNA ligase [Pseudomonadota bacterium]